MWRAALVVCANPSRPCGPNWSSILRATATDGGWVNDPALFPNPGTPAFDEMMAGYAAFGQELARRGIAYRGDPLQPPTSATTVRLRGEKVLTTDGPFAESKEWMSGYYAFECKDLDEALELAARIPGCNFGSVEVRPVASYCSESAAQQGSQVAAQVGATCA